MKFTAEQRAFLLEHNHTAKIATVRKDGHPHVTPVWFDLDGDIIVFTTGHNSAKAMHIRRDTRVSICVDNETPPFSFLIIEGTASLSDDMPALRFWATRLGGRYMGADRAEEYGKRNGVPGELLVRITPTRITFAKDIAS